MPLAAGNAALEEDKAMTRRIITGACLAVLLGVALAFGGWVFSSLFMATICCSMFEVYRCLKTAGHRPVQWPGWLCVIASLILFNVDIGGMSGSVMYLMPLVGAACMLTSAVVLFRHEPKLEDILVSVMPLVCVLLPAMCMLGLQNVENRLHQILLTLMAFGAPLAGDTLAYFIGSQFGKHKLCPAVSPKKSTEGAAAGLLGSILFSMALCGIGAIFGPVQPLWHYVVLGFLCGIAGQLGDLFASLIKRHCGVKDFGTIFPGHGGMMDRLDSVYWATVIVYVYLNLFMIAG